MNPSPNTSPASSKPETLNFDLPAIQSLADGRSGDRSREQRLVLAFISAFRKWQSHRPLSLHEDRALAALGIIATRVSLL